MLVGKRGQFGNKSPFELGEVQASWILIESHVCVMMGDFEYLDGSLSYKRAVVDGGGNKVKQMKIRMTYSLPCTHQSQRSFIVQMELLFNRSYRGKVTCTTFMHTSAEQSMRRAQPAGSSVTCRQGWSTASCLGPSTAS